MLEEFPAVLRIRGLAIPASIKHDGSPLARSLAETLADSPRIQPGRRGFVVEINASSSELSIAVTRPDGLRQFEATVPAVDLPARVVASAAKMFHERLMSPGIQLSSTEINSLDGVPLDAAGRELIDSLASKKAPDQDGPAQTEPAPGPHAAKPYCTKRSYCCTLTHAARCNSTACRGYESGRVNPCNYGPEHRHGS